ncbi:MAG TPA: 2-isopropylmalate synthase, partial [Gemmataceae bacterium]|nr:2-isopropylmalate synthase [Gemmataceae bacterium]
MSDDRLIIFDTTLRDGEQSPGASMNLPEKLEVAHALADLGVDIIEAGFPIASPGDFEAVQAIARQVQGPVICGLARCNEADIDRAWEAVRPSAKPRIHVFLATSAIHREFKLCMAKEEIVRWVVEGVARAKEYCEDIEFSPEDGSRTELDFLAEVVERAIDAGATTINIPDTVGYAVPHQYAAIFRHMKQTVRGIDKVVLSVHCHDDLGLAVANSLAALFEGARQIECTINGLGERAGNCALEEVVMAVRTRGDFFGLRTGIHSKRLCPTSRLVSHITGIPVQRNKAVVGQNAFAHEAGIHQDGLLKDRSTYEIMKPEDVGLTKTEFVLGKHSGRHALRQRVRELGYHLDEDQLQRVFDGFKVLADRKKDIYDADIEALAEAQVHDGPALWTLESFHANAGSGTIPTAAVCLGHRDGQKFTDAACGDGPVDAVFKTIERITGITVNLSDYQVRSVTIGEDAQGEARIEAKHNGRSIRGHGVSTDILEASALAFLQVINRIA